MASFHTQLLQIGDVTISLAVTADNADSATAVGQLGTQMSMARDSIRQAVLESLAPVQEQVRSQPRTQPSAPVAPKTERGPSAAEPEPRQIQAPEAVPSAGPSHGIEQFRITRARTAGLSAGQKLRGEVHAVAASSEMPGSAPTNRYFVVLCSSDGTQAAVYSSWKQAKRHVLEGGIHAQEISSRAVFHAFPSMTEVREYCQAAGVPDVPAAAAVGLQ